MARTTDGTDRTNRTNGTFLGTRSVRVKIIVNHLTRMQSGYVCAAGVDVETRRHVRLMPARGHLRPELLAVHGGTLDIAAIIDLGPAKPVGKLPEIEDCEFDLSNMQGLGPLAPPRFWNMLTQMAKTDLVSLFGRDLRTVWARSCGVDVGRGAASLGCLIPKARPSVYLRTRPGKPAQIRIGFTDGAFDVDVGVTDIRLYGEDHVTPDPEAISAAMTRLGGPDPVILSVGLTRPYTPRDDVAPIHWLQVNNIHFQDEAARKLAAPQW